MSVFSRRALCCVVVFAVCCLASGTTASAVAGIINRVIIQSIKGIDKLVFQAAQSVKGKGFKGLHRGSEVTLDLPVTDIHARLKFLQPNKAWTRDKVEDILTMWAQDADNVSLIDLLHPARARHSWTNKVMPEVKQKWSFDPKNTDDLNRLIDVSEKMCKATTLDPSQLDLSLVLDILELGGIAEQLSAQVKLVVQIIDLELARKDALNLIRAKRYEEWFDKALTSIDDTTPNGKAARAAIDCARNLLKHPAQSDSHAPKHHGSAAPPG